jgi:hypothetical protein
MATNHDRGLDRLEGAIAPKGRTVFIWDDYKPGTVEREKARLIESGSIGPQDHVVSIGWAGAA